MHIQVPKKQCIKSYKVSQGLLSEEQSSDY